ncbi:MAG: hypothetical protein JRD68_03720 [Deltaproteobacteria bacterium]|nr:hypothetical protein [Deltaproteobacteria bacterium]
MVKTIVTRHRFIELMNEELKKHFKYEPGMKIVPVPEGGSGTHIGGYEMEGGSQPWPGVASDVFYKIDKEYTVK